MTKTSRVDKGMPTLLRSRTPDGQARAFLRFFNLLSTRHVGDYSVPELRRIWRLIALALGRRESVAAVTSQEIPGPNGPVHLRIFTPVRGEATQPALLWCHGGGFLVGSTDTADSICRQIARASGVVVASVRYRLAPEHDLYAGREDSLAALEWLARDGASVGIDGARLGIGGDSAGGNIAAAVAQEAARRGHSPLLLQVLAYPATCIGRDYPSKEENATGYFLTAQSMDWMKGVVASSVDLEDRWLSPGCTKDLGGMPPALIVTAGYDPLRDDGLDYAAKLRAAGVPVELLHYAGQFHGFLNFDSILSAGQDGLERIGKALAAALHGVAAPDRTIEIAAKASPQRLGSVARDVTTAAFMAWESSEQWADTGLELKAPRVSRFYRALVAPWLLPGAWARKQLGSKLERLEARQTHPAGGFIAG